MLLIHSQAGAEPTRRIIVRYNLRKYYRMFFSYDKTWFLLQGPFWNWQLFGNTWDSLIIFHDRMEIRPPKLWITTHCKETQDGKHGLWSLVVMLFEANLLWLGGICWQSTYGWPGTCHVQPATKDCKGLYSLLGNHHVRLFSFKN